MPYKLYIQTALCYCIRLHKIICTQWIHLRHRCYATLLRTIYHLNTRIVDKLCAGGVAVVVAAAAVLELVPMHPTQATVQFLGLALVC